MLSTNRQFLAIELQATNEKIHGKFHSKKPFKKEIMNFSDSTFQRFLDDFIKFHENPLCFLKICFAEKTEDVRRNQILKLVADSLKLGYGLVEIKKWSLEITDVLQIKPKHLDPEFLRKIELNVHTSDGKVDIDNLNILVDWKKGAQLKLALKIAQVSVENLRSINKLFLDWRSFREIDLFYNSFEQDPCEFFDVPFKFEKFDSSENLINFTLNSRFRFAPSVVKLTLSNETSSHVLGNPLILERIIRTFRIFDIQRLRKVSHGIRNCVDHLNPETSIEAYTIIMWTEEAVTAVVGKPGYGAKHIFYKKTEGSENIISRVFSDFELNTKDQKTCLSELNMNFSFQSQPEILDNREDCEKKSKAMKAAIIEKLNPITSQFLLGFQKILERRHELLKARKLMLRGVKAIEVVQILKCLDSETLKILDIRDPCLHYSMDYNRGNYPKSLIHPFELDEIAKTSQWRKCSELDISCVPISTSIQKMNLINFSRIHLHTVQAVSARDVQYLRDSLLTVSTLKRFIISFNEFPGRENLYDHIGQPSRIYCEARKVWYFPYSDSREFLEIDLSTQTIYFERVWYMRYVQ